MNDDLNTLIDPDDLDYGNIWDLGAQQRSQKRQEEYRKQKMQELQPKTPHDFFLKGSSRMYKSSFVHSFKIKGKQLSYSSIENIFEVDVLQEDLQYIDFRVNVIQNNILFGLQFIPDKFKDLFLKLAEIKNIVCFRVSKENREIIDILNYRELSEKWQKIKKEIEHNKEIQQIKVEELQQIIDAGNKEYLTDKNIVLNEMCKLFLYRTFFNSFTQFRDDIAFLKYKLNSNIAPEVEVPFELAIRKEIKNTKENFLCYTVDGKNVEFNDERIKEIFCTQFKMLKELYNNYEHNYFAIMEINIDTNWVTSVNCSTKEIINDGSLTAEIICNIEDITDKM